MLLPDVEQAGLHRSINFSVGMMDTCGQTSSSGYHDLTISAAHPNAAAAATAISTFLCPSASWQRNQVVGTAEAAPGSYACNLGWPRGARGLADEAPALARHNGFLGVINPYVPDAWQCGRVSISDVSDGLSNTAAVSERLITSAETFQDLGGVPESLRSYCGGGGSKMSLSTWVDYCGSVPMPDPLFSKYHGRAWISGWTLVANGYMHVMPINQRNCHIYGGEDDGNNIATPSSHHPGGVNLLLGDGAVRFLSATVDMNVWWSLGSRNGGEVHPLP
jgi:hypothetical protein